MMLDVALHERVFLIRDGRATRYLGPGRYRFFGRFGRVKTVRLDTRELIADLDGDRLKLVPSDELQMVDVAAHQRAVVYRKGRPVKWLGPGQHQVWTVERTFKDSARSVSAPAVTVEILDTDAVRVSPLRDELRALVPACDYVEATAPEGSVVLRYVDGALDEVLQPGRHAAWTTVHKVQLAVIDLRERVLQVAGQEVMSKDRVSLRLNLSAAFRVKDARRLATVARAPDDMLYLAMQLAAREAVATRTLDELLASREDAASEMHQAVASRAGVVGLELIRFGMKDVILPGEMKALLNRVIEAQKEAEANVILRREETAATRSLAQTAKVLGESPLLIRLKELEAYKELAAKVGQVHVVLGEGGLPKLELKT
ncbi:MAG TPA: slipin family protein [Myxococcales bacterium]|jgi:regulator of protease activity HflC (stomatin/prohibitin superfamily)